VVMTPSAGTTPNAEAPGAGALSQQTVARQSLSRADCLALLAPGGHGRVAATMRAIPIIIPVSFAVFGEDIVFSAAGVQDAAQAVTNSVVAFEVDHIGSGGRARWDVHVTGVARTVTGEPATPSFRLSSEIMTGWRAGS
jgi:nitroimidazol reductase NimA-like FMN-containing flavoprotein (pyridoxamine 5'-phosphate oxidase superfamily)